MAYSQLAKVFQKINEIIGLDYRSLAIFRIGLGGIIIYDLFARSADLVAHYTDQGVMPCSVQVKEYWKDGFFSLHTLLGNTYYQAFLFALAFLFGFSLIIGYRTKLATIISWVLLLSLQSRNSFVLHGGDVIFRLMLFWSMFLPLGARWSLDSLKRQSLLTHKRICSVASFALTAQIVMIYFFNYATKNDPIWREKYEAVYYTLHIDRLTSDIGRVLLDFPHMMTLLTIGTLILEAFVPFLLFSPYRTGPLKLFVVLSFITFHLGLFMTMELGFFPFVCMVYWFALIPTWFWEKIDPFITFLKGIKSFFSTMFASYLLPVFYSQKQKINFWGKNFLESFLKICLSLFCLFTIIYIFMWNLRSTDFKKYEKYFPRKHNDFAYHLRLDQYWSMFAPRPLKDDGWFVIPITLKDGSTYDLFSQKEEITWEKPTEQSFYFRNQRWRKYMRNIWLKKHAKIRKYFADYLCRQWNEKHKDNPNKHIAKLKIYYMRENTLPPGKSPFRIKKIKLWTHKFSSTNTKKAPKKGA